MTTFEVKATLSYALRHPDCTPVPAEKLMRLAADRIEGLEEDVANLCRAIDRLTGSAGFRQDNSITRDAKAALAKARGEET